MQSGAQVQSADQSADYYATHGYVIVRGLVPIHRIDALMARYREDIVDSTHKFFRQNTNHYEANRRNAHGHVEQSFLDIHAYASYPEFRSAAMEIYFSPEIRQALTAITGSASHHLMQSMLFDLNAATPPHQDWWYLDSIPAGHLLAAWIALEDIAEEAGRFYVLPGSHQVVLHDPGLPHSKWLERMRSHVDERPQELYAPAMRKGDVLFWNSRTIHGSHETRDGRHSRKSLTAHYLPSHLSFGNLFAEKPWVQYSDWNGHKYFANQPEYSVAADLVSRAKLAVYDNPALLKLARKFQRRSIADIK
jgi:phytanoyl-CoA hydroxylase